IIRSEVGRQTGLRHTPTLTFIHDPLPESARHIDELLAAARAKDEEIARMAQRARHAGEPDPYRQPVAAKDLDDDLDDPDDARDGEPDEEGASGRAGRPAK